MENQDINTKLLALFGNTLPITPMMWDEALMSIENSLPELETLVPITHWKGSYTSKFKFYNKDIEGKILSGFYELRIKNMKIKLMIYLNKTCQIKTKYVRVINHMVNNAPHWNLAWVCDQISNEDDKIITNLMGNIMFQIYRDGTKFVHVVGEKIIVDKDYYRTCYDKIEKYLEQFGLSISGGIMEDTIFLDKHKFVRLGQGYESNRITKLNKI